MSRLTPFLTSRNCSYAREGIEIDVPYGDLAKKARDQVKDLEEPYRSIAYRTILQELIQDARKGGSVSKTSSRKTVAPVGAENPVQIFLTNPVNASPYAKLFAARGKLVEKSLAVLKLGRDELGIDGLTAPQVHEILVKKFRVARVHRQNVGTDLAKATEYVTRLKTDDGYKYLLMTAGEQRLEEVATQAK